MKNNSREVKEEDEEEERFRVREFLSKQVDGWDDPVKATLWFRGFSGQRCDWEARYLFWRELILNLARHLGTFIIRPSRLKNIWFRRDDALSPLCIDRVLLEMHNAGDLLLSSDLLDQGRSGRLSFILQKALRVLGFSRPSAVYLTEDYLILSVLLKEKALKVLKYISENHWTSSCVITMANFLAICGGEEESSAILSYLRSCGKATSLAVNKENVIVEGVKVSLSAAAVSGATSLDRDLLHLIWTIERLEQQLHVIDQRCKSSKACAVVSMNSGNKQAALKHARELKLAYQSREKCTVLLNRVEEVLRVITDVESTQKVSEAIKVGAQAIKEKKISPEEIEQCLQDFDVAFSSLKQIEEVLGSVPTCAAAIEDEDVEYELKMIELEVGAGSDKKSDGDHVVRVTEVSQATDSLDNAFSKLSLREIAATKEDLKSTSIKENPDCG